MEINSNQKIQLIESTDIGTEIIGKFVESGIIYLIINDINTGNFISISSFNVNDIINKYLFIDAGTITLNPGYFFRQLNITNGSYSYIFKFTLPRLGNTSKNYIINRISTSRLELEIVKPDPAKTDEELLIDNIISENDFNKFVNDPQLNTNISKLRMFINFGNNNTFLIVNSYYSQDRLYFKLYTPVFDSVDNYARFIIEEQIINSISGNISLYTEDEIADTHTSDELEVTFDSNFADETELVNYNTLKQNLDSTNVLLDLELNSTAEGIKLNTDFRLFDNFIHYSTAVDRINLFKKKITDIEYYDNKISEMSILTSEVYMSSSVEYYNTLRYNTIMSFDSFEKYLYFQSASNVNIDEFDDTQFIIQPWPKIGSIKPYTLYPSNSTEVVTWYDKLIDEADIYDNSNPDKLINFIPVEIQTNEFNNAYTIFIKMISHFLDINYNYIKDMTSINKIKSDIEKGIPKKLILSRLNHFGFEGKNSFSIVPFNTTIPISQL